VAGRLIGRGCDGRVIHVERQRDLAGKRHGVTDVQAEFDRPTGQPSASEAGMPRPFDWLHGYFKTPKNGCKTKCVSPISWQAEDG